MDESAEEELDPPAARRLGEIDVPTLVIDRRARPAVHAQDRRPDRRAASSGRARSTIEDADHVVNLRRPEEFDAALLPFLDG